MSSVVHESDARVDGELLRQWIGRRETREDTVTAASATLLAATLDRGGPALQPGDPLPPLWHWLYFLPVAQMSQVGIDGHPGRGGFLPPVSLPRRMWAASRIAFVSPLRIGETVRRISEVSDVQLKEGKSGSLVFVKLKHALTRRDGVAVIAEEQDIVYREDPRSGAPAAQVQPAPTGAVWVRTLRPDPVLLFRYSALTFNGHRIHYDKTYATETEGYPGLVVHGPLIATLLLEHLQKNLATHSPVARITGFEFRAVRSAFEGRELTLCARPEADGTHVKVWAQDPDGGLCMDAQARVA
jgi:3-methylfumaryl-CoA hydratase